jgi:hypothetical protein
MIENCVTSYMDNPKMNFGKRQNCLLLKGILPDTEVITSTFPKS